MAPLVDPLAARLTALAHDPDAVVQDSGVFPAELVGDPTFRAALAQAWVGLCDASGVIGRLA